MLYLIMNSNKSCIFIFLNLLLYIPISSEVISLPFKIKFSKFQLFYNSTIFLNDYFRKELIAEFDIGSPPQKINGLIEYSTCFWFKKDKSDDLKKYSPKKSSSLEKGNKYEINPNYQHYLDIFYFQGINETNKLDFLLENYKKDSNDTYIPIIGINSPLSFTYTTYIYYSCPNFFGDLKSKKYINKTIWSIKYNNKNEGEIIIGNELFEYNPIKYPKSKYSTLYFKTSLSIFFESIYVQDNWYNTEYINKNDSKFEITTAEFNINFGFIIGTKEYKEYIDKYFFNKLIKRNICIVDLIKYASNNNTNKQFNNTYFYVYSCYKREFEGQTSERHPSINHFNDFPNLVFSSKTIEYDFKLTKDDLFEQISGRYYFFVIFPKNSTDNKKNNRKEVWYLGEPFYKKYPFSVNLDSKTIGFYVDKIHNYKNINNINKTQDVNKTNVDYNFKGKINNVVKYIIEIIVGIMLLFIAYYIGVTVRDKRRKRANELKDDNYEYLPEKNKSINDVPDDSKKQQIELNSKLGLQ